MKRLLTYLAIMVAMTSQAQVYNMQNGSFTTCSGTFYDSGGAAGNYGTNETRQITFCPGTPGSYIQLNFSAFDVEGDPFDYMVIYNGIGTSGAVIADYGIDSPTDCGGMIASSAANGCMTIVFVSDGSIQYSGWAATISCTNTPGGVNTSSPANAICSGAGPFCANAGPLEFPNTSDADCVPDAPNVITNNTCLITAPNPAWYFLEIGIPGNINLTIQQTTGPNGTGTGLDVDYALWGPFPNASAACADFTLGDCIGDHSCTGNVVDCSYSTAAIETATIPNAQVGQVYMVLITNFEGLPGYISMTQTNSGNTGAGSTDCSIVCPTVVGTDPTTCGGTNGFITISDLDPNTNYTVSYLDDGVPVSVALTSNALGIATIMGLDAGNYTNIATNFPGCAANWTNLILSSALAPTAAISYNSPFCTASAVLQNVTITGTGSYTGGSYSSGTGLSLSPTTGAINPAVSVAGTYTVTYTIPAVAPCPATSTTTTVTVGAAPTATLSYSGPFCSSDATIKNPTTTGSGGSFAGPVGLSINTATGGINPSLSVAGTYTVTYTIPASGSCAAVIATASVTISAAPTATVVYNSPFCTSNMTVQMPTVTGSGGTFSAPAGLWIDAATGGINPSLSTAGTYTVTYTIPASGSCAAVTTTATVTISAAPTATVVYNGPFCTSNMTVQMPTVTGGGGIFSAPAGLWIDAATGGINPSLSVAGTYTVTYTIPASGSCAAVTATASVTISAAPTATVVYNSPFCATDATVHTPILTGGGGTFSAPAGLSIDTATGGINPSLSTAGTYTVAYTIPASGSCAAVTATASVTISAAPTATVVYNGPFCASDATVQTPTLTGGGTFSAPAGLWIDAATGGINPSLSTAGTYTVTYTIPASGSCAAVTATASVTISAAPTATVVYNGPFCTSNMTVQMPTVTGGGGTFSAPAGLSIDTATGGLNPSLSTAGTYTVTYTIPASGSCAAVTSTASVTISAAATATIVYNGPFCTSDATLQTPTLTGSGGIFSAPAGLWIDAATGGVNPSLSTAGTYTVAYTIPASGSCAAVTATASVTISAAPTATVVYNGPFCTSDATIQTPTLTGGGGTFSAPAGLWIDAATGGLNPSLSTAGTYTVAYTIPASGSCAAVTATASVTISAAPTATVVYTSPFCATDATVHTPILTGGGGTFSAPAGLWIDAATGGVNPSLSTAGTYTVTYTIPTSGSCAAVTSTASVTISAAPTATIVYNGPFCASDIVIQTPTVTGGGGTFSAPAGLWIDTATGGLNPSLSTAGTYTVAYTIPASGSCAAVTTTATVTISAAPTATVVYNGPFCTSNMTVQMPTVTGGGGIFSAPAGLWIDAATGGINPSLSVAGTYTVTYTLPASGSCAAVTSTASVTISAAPTATVVYNSPFCATDATVHTPILTGGGGTFSAPAGLSIDTATGGINPSLSTAGTYTVTYTIPASGSCAAVTMSATVTISAAPTATVVYNGPFCTSDSTIHTPILTGGGGTFSAPAGLSIDAATGGINPSLSTAGTYTVAYTIPASGSCAAVTATASVTISAAPTATIVYNGPFCTSDATVHTPTLTGGGGIFSAPAGLSIDAATGGINPSLSTAGTYTVTSTIPASGGCTAFTAVATVSILDTPLLMVASASQNVCTGETTAINLSSSVAATSYSWTVVQNNVSGASAGIGDTIAQTLTTNGNTTGTVEYTIIPVSAAGCIGSAVTYVVSVHPLPQASLTGGVICRNPLTGIVTRTLTLDSGLSDTTYDFKWFFNQNLIIGATGSTYLADESGTYSVIATNSVTGCTSDPVSAMVTEAEVAEQITIDGLDAFAENPVITVTVLGSGHYEYQLDDGVFQSSNSFVINQIGDHTIRVRDQDDCTDIAQQLTLIGFPKFFTPNGDGFNDFWNIWSLAGQHASKIEIFDRYGKLIRQLSPGGLGWDGSLNGRPLPSTDYWFVVDFSDRGTLRQFRSHFSLKR